MSTLGAIVTFRPHREHPQFAGHAELAAIVGAIGSNGTASLLVLKPNAEPVWQDAVPPGTDEHYSWTARPDAAATAQQALTAAVTAQATAQGAADAGAAAQTAASQAQTTAAAAHALATKVAALTAAATTPGA
jgi:regulator of protease activity HflC (stomatin/prohibitin superfamily)